MFKYTRRGRAGNGGTLKPWASLAVSAVAVVAVSALTAGCARFERPQTDQLVDAVKEYQTSKSATLAAEGETVFIDAGMDPSVFVLRRDCSWGSAFLLQCDHVVTGPLEHWTYESGKLKLTTRNRLILTELTRVQTVSPEAVEEVILIHDGDPPGQFPQRWAVGAMGGGPSLVGGVGVQYFPFSWYGIEVGGLPTGRLIVLFAGVRLRMMRVGPLRPFVGAAINMMAMPRSDRHYVASLGPRLGVDLELLRGRLAIGAEGDMFRLLTDPPELFGLKGNWIPYGGGSVYVFF